MIPLLVLILAAILWPSAVRAILAWILSLAILGALVALAVRFFS